MKNHHWVRIPKDKEGVSILQGNLSQLFITITSNVLYVGLRRIEL